MSDIATPPTPRPYRVLLEIDGARQWSSSWGYDLNEAIVAAAIKLGSDLGHDGLKVLEVQPDFEAYVRMARGDDR